MYRYLALLSLVIVLSACGPMDSPGVTTSRDPAMRALQAQAEMTGTAQANAEIAAQATITAVVALDRSEREIKQAEKRLQVTQTANAIENIHSTATAGIATMQAGYATATIQAYEGQATQAAIIEDTKNRQKDAEYQRAMSQFWAWFTPVSIVVLGSILLIIIGGFFWKLLDYILKKYGTKETRYGFMTLEPGPTGELVWRLIAGATQERYQKAIDGPKPINVMDIGNSGNALISPGDSKNDNTTASLVKRLVEESEQQLGGTSKRLLGSTELKDWYADQWDRAVKALQSLGIVQPIKGKGTYLVGEYQCLFDLHTALEQRKIRIRPSPTS